MLTDLILYTVGKAS